MNIPISPTDPTLGDFVFRAADRMRIDGCTNAIAREGLSLALYCEHEALLDHYLGLLLARLRAQAPEHRIEVYFPTNTDSLLARFNDALAQQSVEQATQSPSAGSRAQIWIVHDAHVLPDSEIQLLARLIQNFPGANIRAILLMSGTLDEQNKLSAFGRKILRWDIEAPNAEQSQAALELASQDGRLSAVQLLLKRIQRPAWSAQATLLEPEPEHPPPTDTPAPSSSPVPANWIARLHRFHAHGLHALRQSRRAMGPSRPLPLRAILGVGLALTMSTLLMLWLQPEAFGLAKPLNPSAAKTPQAQPLLMPAPAASNESSPSPSPSPRGIAETPNATPTAPTASGSAR